MATATLFPWDDLAGDCRDDPRIRFYVDRESPRTARVRQLVDWTRVLDESSRDRAFRDATALPSYAEFAALANAATRATTRFERLAAGSGWASLRAFLGTRAVRLLILALLVLVSSWYDLAVFASQLAVIALAPAAGLLLRCRRRGEALFWPWFGTSCGLGVVLIGWQASLGATPSPASVLVLLWCNGVIAVLGAGHSVRPLVRTLKMYLLVPSAPGLESRAERARRRWLDDARERAVMPELVQTINRLLQPSQGKRLLVQDTTRLRAIHDAELLVPTRASRRVTEALRRSDGASLAVAGPRGSGKSTLLRSLCSSDSRFAVLVPAPTHYVPKEFLIELFQRLCVTYITDQGFTADRGARLRRRDGLSRYLRGIAPLVLRCALAAGLAALLVWSFAGELSHHLGAWSKGTSDGMDGLAGWSRSQWDAHRRNLQLALAFLLLLAVPRRGWRRLTWRAEPPLVREARRHRQELQAEQTATLQAAGTLPFFQSAFTRGVAFRKLPWTMPQLVGHLSRFLEAVTAAERDRGRTVLVCIDEVDRIGSAAEATRFLGEVKAIFGSVNCYFVVAVADEVGAAFARRAIIGRSLAETAFDEIITLEPLSFASARRLLQRRVPGFTDPFVRLALALSGGLPRELLRVTRRLVELNAEHEYELLLPGLTDRLVREEVLEALEATRGRLAQTQAGPDWAPVLDRLRQLSWSFRPDADISELPRALKELADLAPPPPSGTEESEIWTALNDLAALAALGMTTCDAFADACFDAFGTDAPASASPGPYTELAAARRELALSASSCRAAIDRIRFTLDLA
ncbi:hypothetical protein AB0C84_19765 [Actinomadura sp. NPDC048955]|uniref:hypothetical protein n=1 Tax=Actinomadura sp. NPDC048955 TaxID=3158228 RepID=UPI0033DFEF32